MHLYKLLLIQLCFDWLFICTVVFTMHFLWLHLASEINPCKTFLSLTFFPQLNHILQEMENGLYIQGCPNLQLPPTLHGKNLQFHALLSSIGTGFLLVLATYKMFRFIQLSSVLLTTMSVWRGIGQSSTLPTSVNRDCGTYHLGWKQKVHSPRADDLFWSDHTFLVYAGRGCSSLQRTSLPLLDQYWAEGGSRQMYTVPYQIIQPTCHMWTQSEKKSWGII